MRLALVIAMLATSAWATPGGQRGFYAHMLNYGVNAMLVGQTAYYTFSPASTNSAIDYASTNTMTLYSPSLTTLIGDSVGFGTQSKYGAISSSKINTPSITIAFWARLNSVTNSGGGGFYTSVYQHTAVWKENSGGSYYEGIFIRLLTASNNNVSIILGLANSGVAASQKFFVSQYAAVSPTQNNHYVFTFNGSSKALNLYINGESRLTTNWNYNLQYGALPWEIGRINVSGGQQNFNGTIDELHFYEHELPTENVLKLYNYERVKIP